MSHVTVVGADGAPLLTRVVCDALVDQGRTIDGDPVGYRCTAAATHHIAFTLEDGATATEAIADLCPRCHAMVREETGRVTLTPARASQIPFVMLEPPRTYTEAEVQAAVRGASHAAAGHAVRACAAWLEARGERITPGHFHDLRGLLQGLVASLAAEMRAAMGAEVDRVYKEGKAG
jgi:hypothetical protein